MGPGHRRGDQCRQPGRRDLASWDTTSGNWIAGAGTYQILVGDSSRNLPLTGTLSVSSPITANAMS
jgi:beta-glucosidase